MPWRRIGRGGNYYTQFEQMTWVVSFKPRKISPLLLPIGRVGGPENCSRRFGEDKKNLLTVDALRFLSNASPTCWPYVGLKCVANRAVEGLRKSFEQRQCLFYEAVFLDVRISQIFQFNFQQIRHGVWLQSQVIWYCIKFFIVTVPLVSDVQKPRLFGSRGKAVLRWSMVYISCMWVSNTFAYVRL